MSYDKNACARDIMTSDVFTVSPGKSFNYVEIVAEAIHIRHIPVTDDDDKVLGIISIRDLLHHLTVAGANQFMPVDELMTDRVVTTAPDTTVATLAKQMIDNDVSCVPIIENDKLIGIVTERDLVKLLVEG